jgi:hypothetical protein
MRAELHRLRVLLLSLAGWFRREQQQVIDYLVEENRILREQKKGRKLRLSDDQSIRETKGLWAQPSSPRQPVLAGCSAVGRPFGGQGALHHAWARSVSPP